MGGIIYPLLVEYILRLYVIQFAQSNDLLNKMGTIIVIFKHWELNGPDHSLPSQPLYGAHFWVIKLKDFRKYQHMLV